MGLEFVVVDLTDNQELTEQIAEQSGKMSLPIIKRDDKFIDIDELTE